jgi:hypothetical protein
MLPNLLQCHPIAGQMSHFNPQLTVRWAYIVEVQVQCSYHVT